MMNRSCSWAVARVSQVSLHHLGFLAGTALVADGIIGLMFGLGMGLDTIQWVQEFIIVAFGMVVILVESSDRAALPCCGGSRGTVGGVTTKLRQILYHYAKFLFVPYGRGAYYVYCSMLLFAQYPDHLDVIIGLFMLALSVVMVVVGCRSDSKLKLLKESFNDASDIKSVFAKFQDDDQRLNREQFLDLANGRYGGVLIKLCATPFVVFFMCFVSSIACLVIHRFYTIEQIAKRCGEPWGANEIDAALLAIDECQDGYIEEEELVEWFKHDI